jgi:hypothetical protein
VHSAGQLLTGLPGLRPATPCGCMKLHRKHRACPSPGKPRGGDRAQQHRGQAHGAAAAAGPRHRHRAATAARRTSPTTPGRPTSWCAAAGGPARCTADMVKPGSRRHRRRHQPRRATASSAATSTSSPVREALGPRLDQPGARRRGADDHRDAAASTRLEAAESAARLNPETQDMNALAQPPARPTTLPAFGEHQPRCT